MNSVDYHSGEVYVRCEINFFPPLSGGRYEVYTLWFREEEKGFFLLPSS